MSQRVYHDSILEGVVKGWLEHDEPFILEEDGDSGHGPRCQNIGYAWKTEHHLKHYVNCPGSPDWVPIEYAWIYPNRAVKSQMCLTHEDLVNTVQGGWHKLGLRTINGWVDSIPDRLKDTIKLEGKMCGY